MIRSRQLAPRRSGLSYVDMVVTVLIVGVLAGVTTPRFAASLHRHRAQSAAARIKADLTLARQQAIARSTPVTVRFSLKMNSYSIDGLPHPDRPAEQHVAFLQDAPFQATLLSLSWTGVPTIVFDMHGRPDHGGTLTVAAGSTQQTVVIDPQTGEVSLP